MKRWVSDLPVLPVQKWQSRAEILREHAEQQEIIRLLGLKAELEAIKQAHYARKYDPEQPRVAADNPRGGQWTHEGADDSGVDVDKVLAQAQKLAARRPSMSECVNLCLPLLGRPQPPGSDRNEFDFRKCLNRCLGRLGQ